MVPGPKITMTLQESTITKANDGSRSETWSTVQSLSAVLQRISGKENIQYGRETSDQIYKAYIAYEQFTSTLNAWKLKEKNRLACVLTTNRTYTATTIAFIEGGASADTITDSGSGFVTAKLASGIYLTITGSASNDKIIKANTIIAGTITLDVNDDLTNESAGASVTLSETTMFDIISAEIKDAGNKGKHFEILLEVKK